MSKRSYNPCGFTLIELVCVISIICVVAFFVLPRVSSLNGLFKSSNAIGQTFELIRHLKHKSKKDHRDYILIIDISNNTVSPASIQQEGDTVDTAAANAVQFDDPLTIQDVELPGKGRRYSGSVEIRFSRDGWCDPAMIHIQDEDSTVTIKLEPFLSSPEYIGRYVSANECF